MRWHDQWLVDNSRGLPGDPDCWAYEDWFHEFCEAYRVETGSPRVGDGPIHWRCVTLRKRRYLLPEEHKDCLPRFSRPRRRKVPPVSEAERKLLRSLYWEQPRPRDRLSHTVEFRRIVAKFREGTGRDFAERDVWLLLLREFKGEEGLSRRRGNVERRSVRKGLFE